MGRLLEHKMSFGELSGTLWKLIKEDTIVWGEPTEEEKRAKKKIRKKLFVDSAIPWVLQDLTALLGFYDDAQDIVSFARWNKKILSPKRFANCMKGQAAKGRSGAAAMARCFCPLEKGRRKQRLKKMGPWDMVLLGPLVALGLRLFPPLAPVMWALLAGQVAATFFGYGLKLGPIMGASMELFYRGLGEIGLPFDRSHNKWYQLKQARLLKEFEKGFGAAHLLDWEDRYLAFAASKLALRDAHALPEFIIAPQDYPDIGDLVDDPFGTMGNVVNIFGSLAPNLLAYTVNDFIMPMVKDISRIATGGDAEPIFDFNPSLHAALRVAHSHACPDRNLCQQAIEDTLALEEWAVGEGIDVHQETNWYRMQELWSKWQWNLGQPEPEPDPSIFGPPEL